MVKIGSQTNAKYKKGEEAKKKTCLSGRVAIRASNYLSEPKGHVDVATAQSRIHTKQALRAGEELRRMSSNVPAA